MVLILRNNVILGYTTSMKEAKKYLWNLHIKKGWDTTAVLYKNEKEWWEARCISSNIKDIYTFKKIKKIEKEG